MKAVDEEDLNWLMMPMALAPVRSAEQWEKTKSAIAKNAKQRLDCE